MSIDLVDDIQTLDDLRAYVHQTLCEKENLLPDQFKIVASQLRKQGQNCGYQFSLKGPRALRLEAIWAADHNAIYFYDARGVRYRKVRLRRRLSMESGAAST